MQHLCIKPLIVAVAAILIWNALNSQQVTAGSVRVAEGTRMLLELNEDLSTCSSREGDVFTATLYRPVPARGQALIPAGSVVTGSVSRISRSGRFSGRTVMHLLLHSLRLPGGTELPLGASVVSVSKGERFEAIGEMGIISERPPAKSAPRSEGQALIGGGRDTILREDSRAEAATGPGNLTAFVTILGARGKDLELGRGTRIEIVLDRPLMVPEAGVPEGKPPQ